MSAQLSGPSPSEDGNAAILADVAHALGAAVPEVCIPGVIANVRLLKHHLDVLRAAGDFQGATAAAT